MNASQKATVRKGKRMRRENVKVRARWDIEGRKATLCRIFAV